MGKVQRDRRKLHISAAKLPNASNQVEVVEMTEADVSKEKSSMASLRLSDNMFEGLNINQELLTKKLPEFDIMSTITSKSTKGLQLKKKDKKKLRHDVWLNKMNALEVIRDNEREQKRRQKTVIVGDMAPLADTLPTLELLLKSSNSSRTKSDAEKKTKGIRKMKQRQKQMLQDMAVFKQVLSHPEFIKNPTGTITEHLHNKQKLEDENMDT